MEIQDDDEISTEKIVTSQRVEVHNPADWRNEWHEPWQRCGGGQPGVCLLGCCFCEANMTSCASVGKMEVTTRPGHVHHLGGRRWQWCGLIYLLGVCGIWLPWRPENYIIGQAARKRSVDIFRDVKKSFQSIFLSQVQDKGEHRRGLHDGLSLLLLLFKLPDHPRDPGAK